LQTSSDGARVFLLDLDSGLTVYDIRADGAPSFLGNLGGLGYTEHLQLMPDNKLICFGQTFRGLIQGVAVQSNIGLAELSGSPFAAETHNVGFTCLANGSRFYAVTRENAWIQTFAVSSDGVLTSFGLPFQLADPQNRLPNAVAYWERESRKHHSHSNPKSIAAPSNPAHTVELDQTE
jgi:hypothetical protein